MPPALELCGVEIANPARTYSYQHLFPSTLTWSGALPETAFLSGPSAYRAFADPATDPAPWHDQDHPESARFLGFLASDVTGYGSPASRTTTPRAGYLQGGSFNREHLDVREHEWTGTLIAQDAAGLEWGKRWLANVMGAACDTCGTCDSIVRVYAPETGIDWEEGRFLEYEVGVLSGPTYTPISETICGCTFTLGAGNPWLYKEPISAIVNQPLVAAVDDPGGCMPFQDWLCGELPQDNVCLTMLPPKEGEYGPIVYLDATLGAASGIIVTMYPDCPSEGVPDVTTGRGITIPRLDLGWQLVIDSAKGIINASDPDGRLLNGSNLVRALNHADPFLRIRDCDNTGCICVGVLHPCNGGEQTIVSMEYQQRMR